MQRQRIARETCTFNAQYCNLFTKVPFDVDTSFNGEYNFLLHGLHFIDASADFIDWNRDAKVINSAMLAQRRYLANWAKFQFWPLYTPYGTTTQGGYVYQMGSL